MDDLKHARKRLKKYFMPFFDGGTDGEAKAQERKLKRKEWELKKKQLEKLKELEKFQSDDKKRSELKVALKGENGPGNKGQKGKGKGVITTDGKGTGKGKPSASERINQTSKGESGW